MISVEKISEESEFSKLQTTWNNLLKQSDADNPFLTWEWLYSWWKFYGDKSELMILVVREDDKILALAPLMHRVKLFGLLKIKEILFLGSFGVGSDYLDFIITRGRESSSVDQIFHYLTRNQQKWDAINLTNIPETSKSIAHVKEACDKLGYFNIENASVVCPSIQLPSTWEEYVLTLSKSMRSNIKRKHRELSKTTEIEYEVIRERGDLDAAVNSMIRLNRLRMETKNLHGAFKNGKFTEFHQDVMPVLFQNDFLHLSFLKANNTRIAALYNFIYNDTCFYYQSGFDPVWAKFSPGTVLFSLSIQDAIANGMLEYDFLQGDEPYKFSWTNTKRQCVTILIYNKTLMGSWLYFLFLLKSHIKKTLRRGS
jgi:CelD/BcsL family acetyltransferase involved in cellulose biosynthesis